MYVLCHQCCCLRLHVRQCAKCTDLEQDIGHLSVNAIKDCFCSTSSDFHSWILMQCGSQQSSCNKNARALQPMAPSFIALTVVPVLITVNTPHRSSRKFHRLTVPQTIAAPGCTPFTYKWGYHAIQAARNGQSRLVTVYAIPETCPPLCWDCSQYAAWASAACLKSSLTL